MSQVFLGMSRWSSAASVPLHRQGAEWWVSLSSRPTSSIPWSEQLAVLCSNPCLEKLKLVPNTNSWVGLSGSDATSLAQTLSSYCTRFGLLFKFNLLFICTSLQYSPTCVVLVYTGLYVYTTNTPFHPLLIRVWGVSNQQWSQKGFTSSLPLIFLRGKINFFLRGSTASLNASLHNLY